MDIDRKDIDKMREVLSILQSMLLKYDNPEMDELGNSTQFCTVYELKDAAFRLHAAIIHAEDG